MHNREVAWHLQTISILLEIKGENPFKSRAYSNAARSVKRLTRPVSEKVADGSFANVQGIGPGIMAVVQELIAQGESSLLTELRDTVPPALVELGSIPGLGAKTARILVKELGVQTIAELEAAAEAGRVRQISGFGTKKEQQILAGIELLRSQGSMVPIGISRPVAEMVVKLLGQCEAVSQVSIAGSVRRWQEISTNVDLVLAVRDVPETVAFLSRIKGIKVRQVDEDQILLETSMDLELRLWLVDWEDFAAGLVRCTGPQEHVQALGLLGELRGATEAEVYSRLGLHWIPPEVRRPGLDLVDYELKSPPPPLVEAGDIRGDLHMHSMWSDGVLDIPSLAALAAQRGYEYIAVTDHSPALAIARGLTVERLHRQIEEIRSLQASLPVAVLTGIEVDIKADGSLDLPDSVLETLDWVVASVHSRFGMGKDAMTQRLVSAMANPHVNVLGHPSGRILQRRPGYELDWIRVFAAAREYNVALEVNASPDRLDINDEIIRLACAKGVKIVINTDAHSGGELNNMRYGVATARRGGAKKTDVLNSLTLRELMHHKQV